MFWYSQKSKEQMEKLVKERIIFDKELEEQRIRGSYTGPPGVTTSREDYEKNVYASIDVLVDKCEIHIDKCEIFKG